jgi:hypothetical protein
MMSASWLIAELPRNWKARRFAQPFLVGGDDAHHRHVLGEGDVRGR